MPSIARFHGLIVYMYTEYDEVHHLPHFHMRYAELWASFSLDPLSWPGLKCIQTS
ncbi:MAG: DUF4160 domain-containing protein [Caldilineaceae bacterium]|nr:DUF4160 domain-containing protein [Caldilineaceae bacterium]